MKRFHFEKTFAADFETTVYDGQKDTEVWSSALVELGTENVIIHTSIEQTFYFLQAQKGDVLLWYHNLKFDGSFWLDFLLRDLEMEQAMINDVWIADEYMKNKTFKYMISDKGQWYSITIKVNDHYIVIRDSVKLFPFSLAELGKAFKTKHQKLNMEYKGIRHKNGVIKDDEKEYIKNDVLVLKEALEFMLENGHEKSTIGSNCLSEFKKGFDAQDYKLFFPQLEEIPISIEYGAENADKYIRHSYRGGWCYLVEEKANKLFENGLTADVNSLYPSMMSSESGNSYPIGNPYFWRGNFLHEKTEQDNTYYFVRFKCRFELKEGYLPFIQIKNNPLYEPTKMLRTSDFYDKKTDTYYRYLNIAGKKTECVVELTLTKTDFILFKEHYNIYDLEILDGVWFYTAIGIFDDYINKYKKQKMESVGALRTLAKLFLNNLYGKEATNDDSSFKVAYLNDNAELKFRNVEEHEKKCGYIAIGSAITSYAREFTIRTAQKNYHGLNKRGFIYADTDSIHCDLKPEELIDVPVHPTDFCHWALESTWDKGIFVRQKTYLEHITEQDLKPCEPYINVTCAGMPKKCKDLFIKSIEGYEPKIEDKYTKEELHFLETKRTIEDFKVGLEVPGKLVPKRIKGGVILCDTTYQIR